MRIPYDNIHYDIRDMLSRNCIVNLICSLRGLGKTYLRTKRKNSFIYVDIGLNLIELILFSMIFKIFILK